MENKIIEEVLARGAYKASIIPAREIRTDRAFRDMCKANACGMYGKCYMCPPDVGDIDVLTARLGDYRSVLVYQTVTELEDSFDFETMVEARKNLNRTAQDLRGVFAELGLKKVLHLGAGGCGVCKPCAKQSGEPCRFPEKALASLEAYGINVNELAKSAGMKYINGQDTVTYFGAVLFTPDGE